MAVLGGVARSWSALGAVLGQSWGSMGCVWVFLGCAGCACCVGCAGCAGCVGCVGCAGCAGCCLRLLFATASVSGSALVVSGCSGCLGRSRLKFDCCTRPWACFVELISCSRPWACFVELIRCIRPWACFVEFKRRFPFSSCSGFGVQLGTENPQNRYKTNEKSIKSTCSLLGRSWPLLVVLGAFLVRLGAVLGRSWGVLGRSWAALVRSWGGLGAILGRFRSPLGLKNLHFPLVLQRFSKNHDF